VHQFLSPRQSSTGPFIGSPNWKKLSRLVTIKPPPKHSATWPGWVSASVMAGPAPRRRWAVQANPALKLHETPAQENAPVAADKLLIGMADLVNLTSLGLRTLRRMDASRDIPGRVVAGRRVLFQSEIIREWVRAGLPDRDHWSALQKQLGKR
jgi:hypothetical protein